MVASGTMSPWTPGVTAGAAAHRTVYGPVRFTFADALSMVERGILPEDATVELLDGALVYRDRFDLRGDEVVEGFKHNFVIAALAELGPRVNDDRRHVRTQSTLKCSETHAPIPDGMILRGSLRQYVNIPTAADAHCVIEVADSSYERDAGEKLAAYARAGIGQYVIVNLRNRTAEVYAGPDRAGGTFADLATVREDQKLALGVGEGEFVSVPLDELLPPREGTGS